MFQRGSFFIDADQQMKHIQSFKLIRMYCNPECLIKRHVLRLVTIPISLTEQKLIIFYTFLVKDA